MNCSPIGHHLERLLKNKLKERLNHGNVMYLTSVIKIRRRHPAYSSIDSFCLLSKKLRNKAIWIQREEYKKHDRIFSFFEMVKFLRESNDVDYRNLPSKVALETLKDVDSSYNSFFSLCRKGISANLPKFSPKGESGRYRVTFNYETFSKVSFRKGYIKVTGIPYEFKVPKHLSFLTIAEIKMIRFVPKGTSYQMEIVYTTQEVEYKDTGNYLAIDLGMRNFLTIVGNNSTPTIIKGGKFISTNSYWIKKKSSHQSKLKKGVYSSKKIKFLDEKRNNKIRNDINCLTNQLINYIQGLNVSDVYIGWNKDIKCGINLGKETNQKFVYLPHKRLIDNLTYKCKRVGVKVHVVNEAYTSKCSFIDDEEICRHETYKGKRITTKFFVSKEGKKINADVNAAYNILKLSRGIRINNLDPRQVLGTPKILNIDYGHI